MSTSAADFVGSIPEHYHRHLGPLLFEGFAEDLAQRAADLQPVAVLELASGTGILTERLLGQLLPDADLLATDLNGAMLEQAHGRLGNRSALRFAAMDAQQLDAAAETFDLVISQFGVMFFPDRVGAYREAHRVLLPGGQLLFSTWADWAHNPFARIAHETVASNWPDNPPGFYRVPFGYHDPQQIRQELHAAGFADISIVAQSLSVDIPNHSDFAAGLVIGNPLHAELLARGADVPAVIAAVSTALLDNLGSSMPLQALVVSARKEE